MTVPSTRPTSPNSRLRRRLTTVRRSQTGALSAEFAVLLCVGAGMAFLLYSGLKSGGVATFLVGLIKEFIGAFGGLG